METCDLSPTTKRRPACHVGTIFYDFAMLFCVTVHHFSSRNILSVTCEILALYIQAGQQHCVGTNDVNSNCTEEKKQGNERNHLGQIEGNNNKLDDTYELLKPEVTSNVVSCSGAVCYFTLGFSCCYKRDGLEFPCMMSNF